MPARSRLSHYLILFTLLLGSSGCTTIYNPATQRKETLLLDTPSEVALGQDMDKQVRQKLQLIANPQIQDRLNLIGSKIAAASDRQDIVYQFQIVKDKELNAFAIPGGYIYVHSALMDAAGDDELAAVLGHEVGHLAARHSVKQLQAVMGYQLLMSIVVGASGKQNILQATDIIFSLVNLGYSRQDEYLADKLGVKYTKRAGFNPYGAVTFFRKLQAEADKEGPQANIVFLSSHPPIYERIKRVEAEISNLGP
jgi:predicted Zn-dependent protease